MPKISKLKGFKPIRGDKKRVAAYARVSMDSEQLMHSLSAQVCFYSRLI